MISVIAFVHSHSTHMSGEWLEQFAWDKSDSCISVNLAADRIFMVQRHLITEASSLSYNLPTTLNSFHREPVKCPSHASVWACWGLWQGVFKVTELDWLIQPKVGVLCVLQADCCTLMIFFNHESDRNLPKCSIRSHYPKIFFYENSYTVHKYSCIKLPFKKFMFTQASIDLEGVWGKEGRGRQGGEYP